MLKKCPFCGAAPKCYKQYREYHVSKNGIGKNELFWRVRCQKCKVETDIGLKNEIMKIWNNRKDI